MVKELSSSYPIADILETIEELEKAGVILEKKDIPEDINYTPPKQIPITGLTLNICHDCILRCIYCYGDAGTYGGERAYMSRETAESSVDLLFSEAKGSKRPCRIVFFGSEPLLNFELIKHIVEYSKEKAEKLEMKVKFNLTTNGILLSDEVINYLNEENIGVLLSIDGPKEIQDKQRPHMLDGVSSYDTMLPRVKRLIESRNGKVSARVTVTHYNTDLLLLTRHLTELGCNNVYFTPVSAKGKEAYSLTKDDLNLMDISYRDLVDHVIDRTKMGESVTASLLSRVLLGFYSPEARLYVCGAGRGLLVVSPEGDFYPCHRLVGIEEFKIGNITDGLDRSFQRRILAHPVDKRKSCKSCWARYYCGGGCYYDNYLANGDIFIPDKTGCALTKKVIEFHGRVYADLYENDRELLDKICKRALSMYNKEEPHKIGV